MALFQDAWSATATYAVGDLVNYSGVVYRARAAVTGNANNNNPCVDTTNWAVSYVERVESLTSIVETVRQELNVDDDAINNSVVEFIHRGSVYVNQRLRPPTSLTSFLTPVIEITSPSGYTGRRYIRVPANVLNIENIRINTTNPGFYGLLGQGSIEFLAADTEQDFEIVSQYYRNQDNIFGYRTISNHQAPLWRYRTIGGTQYIELAPAENLDVGTEIEIVYYRSEPQLGEQRPRINSAGQPVNSNGQNAAQFAADTTVNHTPAVADINIPGTMSFAAGDGITVTVVVTRPDGVTDTSTTTVTLGAATNGNGARDLIRQAIADEVDSAFATVSDFGGSQIRITSVGRGQGNTVTVTATGVIGAASTLTNGAGGPNFVQQIVRIEENWYTQNAPYCLVYAALFHASAWLKDNERSAYWKQLYQEEEARTEDLIYRFEQVRPTDQQMSSPYAI